MIFPWTVISVNIVYDNQCFYSSSSSSYSSYIAQYPDHRGKKQRGGTRALLRYFRIRAPSSGVEVRNVNKRTCQYSEAVKYHKRCQQCIYRSYKVMILNNKNRAHHVFDLLFRGN